MGQPVPSGRAVLRRPDRGDPRGFPARPCGDGVAGSVPGRRAPLPRGGDDGGGRHRALRRGGAHGPRRLRPRHRDVARPRRGTRCHPRGTARRCLHHRRHSQLLGPPGRAQARHPRAPRRFLPSRAGLRRHPPDRAVRGAAGRADERAASGDDPLGRDDDRQGALRLLPRHRGRGRRLRDRAPRERPDPGGVRGDPLHLFGGQHQLAPATRPPDVPGHRGCGAGGTTDRHHPLHAGRSHGPRDAARRAGAAECRGAGRDRPGADREAGRAGLLRLVHLQRGHAHGVARLRHPRIREGRLRLGATGPALRPAAALLGGDGLERAGRAGGLRDADVAVGGR